ncbi:SDR family oxidoreductase [Zunongwangia sp.]|uniref:SDR family oxidoreductase n=1 Tax=Zunongwangia sp. TaxID=1965325 RepID=UPI003AA7C097
MHPNLEKLKEYKILVTGGAGFIGSNLCEALLKLGAEVICLDNFSTGRKENIYGFLGNPLFTLIEGDIRDLKVCQEACKNVDFVLHEAALGSVPRSIENPITTNKVNIDGFLNMLVAVKNSKVNRFIYAASSSTYGDSTELPKTEDKIGKPLSPYAVTKYVNELYAEVFHKTYQINTIGLRYFNVFGKHQNPNGAYAAVIPKFIQQLIHKESPVINGDGSFSRDFTYIDNVVQINILAILVENPAALNQVYNVACGERTTLNQLISILKEKLAAFDSSISEVTPTYGPTRMGDIPHSNANIAKAKNLLQYNPQFTVKKGLKKAISWYWNNLN